VEWTIQHYLVFLKLLKINKIENLMGITGRAVIVPFAELGMDVDKPHQLELVESDLAVQV